MASAFGHAVSGIALTSFYSFNKRDCALVLFCAIGCSIVPDADVLAFRFGIPYEHPFGHRGFTHSIFFAVLFATLCRWIFFSKTKFCSKRGWSLWTLFFLCTVSHGVLDAMTTGGRGIAFFGPFDNTRYFLPWRVIKVSPLSASRFFSERGLTVLKSEAVFIGIPSLVFMLFNYLRKRLRNK